MISARLPACSTHRAVAVNQPIARVRIDVPVRHLDRDFDYRVPDDMSAPVGSRVRVRFARRLVDGIVVGHADEAEVERVAPIERVIGDIPTLTPQTIELVRAVADRYAGTFWDVVRTAVPPRHARAERETRPTPLPPFDPRVDDTWSAYRDGDVLQSDIRAGRTVRAVWSSAPASDSIAEIVSLVGANPGGTLVLVPDRRDVQRLLRELAPVVGTDATAVLVNDMGPQRRYREFLRTLHGSARLCVGNRSAAFAPVRDLSLIVMWDDADDSYSEPRSPYWDAREVCALRSHLEDCSLVVGGPARSVVTQSWVERGWARSIDFAGRSSLRVRGLRPEDAAGDVASASARIPRRAWEAAQQGLEEGPVLVSVARRGYIPALVCQACGTPAQCQCGGPLRMTVAGALECRWCGSTAPTRSCGACGDSRVRATSIGAERTAEELGRAFPGVPVTFSQADHMIDRVKNRPAIVVATAGAEPIADGGFAAAVILDAGNRYVRLTQAEDAVHRWFSVAMRARPDAPIFVTAAESDPGVQALLRWDAPWFAARELVERESARLPPATRLAVIRGARADIEAVVADLTCTHVVLGPVEVEDTWRVIVIAPRSEGTAFTTQLRHSAMTRSAHRGSGAISIHVDPRDIDE
jgi:primosomal protein N' (replication factor Y)